MSTISYFVAIEFGGTKIFVAIGTDDGEIIERSKIDTITPDITMPQVIEVLKKYHEKYNFISIGIGGFGPIDITESSPDYGLIKSSPKISWNGFNIIKYIKQYFTVHAFLNTDVNGAVLCEWLWGYNKKISNLLYLTIGTGIGGGVIANNKIFNGHAHTELGHVYIPKHPKDIEFKGVCPYHEGCFEGLASGPSLLQRHDVMRTHLLPEDHIAWDIEAYYIAHAINNYIFCFTPDKIILGGGVMGNKFLFPKIQKYVPPLLNKYIQYSEIDDITNFIVPASFGDNTGVKGALALGIIGLNRKLKKFNIP